MLNLWRSHLYRQLYKHTYFNLIYVITASHKIGNLIFVYLQLPIRNNNKREARL